MGFAKLTGMMVMIALFSIAMFTFVIKFGYDNDANINLADEGNFNSSVTNTKDDVSVFYSDVNTSSAEYQKTTISSLTEATEGGTPFKVTATSSLSMVKRSLSSVWETIFGSDDDGDNLGFGLVLTALISMLGFIWILYSYKAWAGRNPD